MEKIEPTMRQRYHAARKKHTLSSTDRRQRMRAGTLVPLLNGLMALMPAVGRCGPSLAGTLGYRVS